MTAKQLTLGLEAVRTHEMHFGDMGAMNNGYHNVNYALATMRHLTLGLAALVAHGMHFKIMAAVEIGVSNATRV